MSTWASSHVGHTVPQAVWAVCQGAVVLSCFMSTWASSHVRHTVPQTPWDGGLGAVISRFISTEHPAMSDVQCCKQHELVAKKQSLFFALCSTGAPSHVGHAAPQAAWAGCQGDRATADVHPVPDAQRQPPGQDHGLRSRGHGLHAERAGPMANREQGACTGSTAGEKVSSDISRLRGRHSAVTVLICLLLLGAVYVSDFMDNNSTKIRKVILYCPVKGNLLWNLPITINVTCKIDQFKFNAW